jgi:hypothetical protein
MTTRTLYVGPTSGGAADGTSWANRYGTMSNCEAKPVQAGDTVYVGPGVYREQMTCGVSGGSSYTTGTVSVTNGSATVTGSGTSWAANAFAGGIFQVHSVAAGADGVTDGTSTFSSAAGNFQTGMTGMAIRIATKAAAILTYVSATAVTLADTAGTAITPSAANTLTYNVGPEPPYDIASVTDDTHLVLTQPWSGPSLTGLAYETWQDIKYLADVTGAHTDAIGGQVRWTGSTTDLVGARASCVVGNTKDYRTFIGFALDGCTASGSPVKSPNSNWIVANCSFQTWAASDVIYQSAGVNLSVLNCQFPGSHPNSGCIHFVYASTAEINAYIESCHFSSGNFGVACEKAGGIRINNCTFTGRNAEAVIIGTALAVGSTVAIRNSILTGGGTSAAVKATAVGEILEDYNAFAGNGTDRTSVTVGAHSTTNIPIFNMPLLSPGLVIPPGPPYALSEWSGMRGLTGFGMAATDMYGLTRPTTASKKSWGAIQYQPVLKSPTQAQAGSYSLKLEDAGSAHIFVPTTNTATTITVYCYREADYAGTNPTMVISQPGQVDITVTDAGAAAGWNQITSGAFTPAASPGFVVVKLKSFNTATAGSYGTYFDTLAVA